MQPHFESELRRLSEVWGGPGAAMLLAWNGEEPAGCVALHLLPQQPTAAEMKRMWVAPSARGQGCGRRLVNAAASWAREHGADRLLLDTVPAAMPAAYRVYLQAGFTPCARYNSNPVPGVIFLERRLG